MIVAGKPAKFAQSHAAGIYDHVSAWQDDSRITFRNHMVARLAAIAHRNMHKFIVLSN